MKGHEKSERTQFLKKSFFLISNLNNHSFTAQIGNVNKKIRHDNTEKQQKFRLSFSRNIFTNLKLNKALVFTHLYFKLHS